MATPRQIEYIQGFVNCIAETKNNIDKNPPEWAIHQNITYARICYREIKDINDSIIKSSLKDLNELERGVGWGETR